MDRASGSGVFARDPDALLDMIQIDPRDVGKSLEEGQSAWRISSVLREFKTPDSIDVIFDFPVHRITNDLKEAKPLSGSDSSTNSKRGNAAKSDKAEEKYERLLSFVENWDEYDTKEAKTKYPSLAEAVEFFSMEKGYSKNAIRAWVNNHDDLQIIHGVLLPKY